MQTEGKVRIVIVECEGGATALAAALRMALGDSAQVSVERTEPPVVIPSPPPPPKAPQELQRNYVKTRKSATPPAAAPAAAPKDTGEPKPPSGAVQKAVRLAIQLSPSTPQEVHQYVVSTGVKTTSGSVQQCLYQLTRKGEAVREEDGRYRLK